MSTTPELLPTPSPAPEVTPPVTPTPDTSSEWINRAKSPALLKWEHDTIEPRRNEKMVEIDRLLDYHLAAKEYVDAYDNQKAKALDAMKMYINRAYAICMAEAHQSDVNSQGRALWNARFFKEANDDVNQYISMITAFLIEAAKKNEGLVKGSEKGKIDLNALFDLADRGRDIYTQISKDPKYGALLHKINTHVPLEVQDSEFIIEKFPKREAGPMSVDDNMKLLEASGAITLLYAMNPKQRMEFAKYIIEKKPEDKERIIGLITSFGSSGFLTPLHFKELYPMMRDKKIIDQKQQESMETTIEIGQAKAASIRTNIDVGIRTDMDKNQAIKFMEPRYIGGLALVTWRAANMALSLVAYRNDLTEYLKSPWMYVDVAGIIAGSALMGNPTILEWVKENGGKKLEDQAVMMALCEMIIGKPNITEKYFARARKDIPGGKKETGMVELLSLMRKEKKSRKQPMGVKIEEILTFAEGKDSKTKNHEAIKGVSPELIALLKSVSGKEKDDLEQYANVVLASKTTLTTEILEQRVAKMKSLHGIK